MPPHENKLLIIKACMLLLIFLTPSCKAQSYTWKTVMMAAGKVSKFAEGVPSIKLNLFTKENKCEH